MKSFGSDSLLMKPGGDVSKHNFMKLRFKITARNHTLYNVCFEWSILELAGEARLVRL